MLKAYKNCPFFAMRREEEFLGDDMQACELVLQFFAKAYVRHAVGPFMWHAIHSSLHQPVKKLPQKEKANNCLSTNKGFIGLGISGRGVGLGVEVNNGYGLG